MNIIIKSLLQPILVILIILTLSACMSQTNQILDINVSIGAFGGTITPRHMKKLRSYSSNPYVLGTMASPPKAPFDSFLNATEVAIFYHNNEAAEYLISIGATNKVSARWHDPVTDILTRSELVIPAAELACGMGNFDMMNMYLQAYPGDKINYTNCLHQYVSYGASLDPNQTEKGHIGEVVDTIVSLGGNVGGAPEYGRPLYNSALDYKDYTGLLQSLLNHGLNPHRVFPCLMGECTYFSELANLVDSDSASKKADLIFAHGADVNQAVSFKIPVDVLITGELKYERRALSPLHIAAYFDSPELYAKLIFLGADVNQLDNLGNKPGKYAGIYKEFERLSSRQKSLYDEKKRRQREASRRNNDFFGKAVALGFGAIAIGSADVSSDITAKAFGAFAQDVISDSGGSNLNKLNQEALSNLERDQQKFNAEVEVINKRSQNYDKSQAEITQNTGTTKAIDCGNEYIRTRTGLYSEGGAIACDEAVEGVGYCSHYRRWVRNGEINRRLAGAGLPQCQKAMNRPDRTTPGVPSSSNKTMDR